VKIPNADRKNPRPQQSAAETRNLTATVEFGEDSVPAERAVHRVEDELVQPRLRNFQKDGIWAESAVAMRGTVGLEWALVTQGKLEMKLASGSGGYRGV
jgi:hypothetical protein